tara:strand:- start:360 stop:764 length:405 start_codon:yes stop_codon:yes gene_type:complete
MLNIKKTNNLRGENKMEYKNHIIKPADNFNKDFLIYKLINGNQRFVKGVTSIEKAKNFIDGGESMNKKKVNVLLSIEELNELLAAVNYYRRKENSDKIIYGENNELGRDNAGYHLDLKLNHILVSEEDKERANV